MMAGGMSTSSTVAGMTVPTETEKFTLGTDRMFTFVNDWRICVRCSFEMFTEPVEVADALDADPLVLLEPLFESAAVPPLESPLLESAAVPPLESPLFESAAAPLPCRAPPAEPPVAALPEPLPWVLVAAPPPVPPAVLDVPPVPLVEAVPLPEPPALPDAPPEPAVVDAPPEPLPPVMVEPEPPTEPDPPPLPDPPADAAEPPELGTVVPDEPLAKLPATVNAKAVAATVLNNPIRMLTSRKSVARIRH
jgi:hypothetical protein